jgi:hypothetical protein
VASGPKAGSRPCSNVELALHQPSTDAADRGRSHWHSQSHVRDQNRLSGGRTWWAHFEFTRVNTTPTILRKKIEELMNIKGIGEKSFLKLKPMVIVSPQKAEAAR